VATLRDRFRAAVGGLPPVYWTLWSGMLVNRLASFVVTFLALFLVREHGFTADEAGSVVALFGVGLLLAGPIGGALADRLGRRLTMLLGLVLGGASVASLGVLDAPWALAIATFFAALTGELYRPAAQAVVADVVPPADRARAYGLIYWAVNLGWAVSLSIAGFVAEWSLRALFFADAVTSLLFALIVAARVPETRPAVGGEDTPVFAGFREVFADGTLLVFLGLHLVALTVFTQFQLAAPLDMAAHGHGPKVFALLMAMNGLGVGLLQPFASQRLANVDGARLLAVSALLFGAGFGLYAVSGALWAWILGGLLWTVGEVVGFPVASAIVADLAPRHLRGRYQGAFSMTWGLAFALAPVIGGHVLEGFGGRVLWTGCFVAGAAVAVGHLLAGGPRRRQLEARRGA